MDFTEQLMMFEEFGNVYAREEFVQAREVCGLPMMDMFHAMWNGQLTGEKIPNLPLQTWTNFLRENELPVKRT